MPDETETAPRPRWWQWRPSWKLVVFVVLFAALFTAFIVDHSQNSHAGQVRSQAVTEEVAWLAGQTQGAITQDGGLGGWDNSTDHLSFMLNVGGCRHVSAYAVVPPRPTGPGDVVLHIIVPLPSHQTRDVTVRDGSTLAAFKQVVAHSMLGICAGGDPRLEPQAW